jgi:hypothetical protein
VICTAWLSWAQTGRLTGIAVPARTRQFYLPDTNVLITQFFSEDGVGEVEDACSFWRVEALARAGKLDEAQLAFERMLTYANHLGLYAEQISKTGEQLGNFPQALTHLALISAAFNLDRALG